MEIEVIDPLDVSLGHSPETIRRGLQGVTQPDTHRRPVLKARLPRQGVKPAPFSFSAVRRWPLLTVVASTMIGVICGAILTKRSTSI